MHEAFNIRGLGREQFRAVPVDGLARAKGDDGREADLGEQATGVEIGKSPALAAAGVEPFLFVGGGTGQRDWDISGGGVAGDVAKQGAKGSSTVGLKRIQSTFKNPKRNN